LADSLDIETRAVYPVDLELRQGGFRGFFPYGSTATVRDRGRVRKERFQPHAFRFAVEDLNREINFLYGHNLSQPLASRSAGTLILTDTAAGLEFDAELPPEGRQPTWVRDFLLAHEAGMIRGISPGFTVPPTSAVAEPERIEPEPGNPGVGIRVIREAVLFELSAVTRPAYSDTVLEARQVQGGEPIDLLRFYRWL